MKENIHPKYKETKVTCSCGNTFVTSSTLANDELHVDICSNCHPFYTGKQKVVDTGGRVDRFKQKYIQKSQPIEKPKAEETKAITIKKKSQSTTKAAAKTKASTKTKKAE